jgi:hypothetical protein
MIISPHIIDLDQFAIKASDAPPTPSRRRRAPKPRGRFLKGPINWDWLSAAAKLTGKALHAALVIQFLAGMKKSKTINLSSDELGRVSVSRTAGYRALKRLEKAGLVDVIRGRGRLPTVTIRPYLLTTTETA